MALSVPSLEIFRHRSYRRYWIQRQLSAAARQMLAVSIGWQVYDLARETRGVEESAFVLGMVGLAQFGPVFLLSLFGGQAADRYDRKTILIVCNLVRLAAIAGLLAASFASASAAIPAIFAASAVMGGVNAFFPAASNALYPKLVPADELPQAIAWNSLGFQTGSIVGPAIGGFLYIGGPLLAYGVAFAMIAVAVVVLTGVENPPRAARETRPAGALMLEGLRYVATNKTVLGAISLDLVVVFFGGATALLPVFARDVLDVGAGGLGALRAAPAVGAVVVAAWLAARPLERRVGSWMLGAVALFGVAMAGFGVSEVFWVSAGFLVLAGAADMVSVYVRQSLIQLATPDAMRGRVSAVSYIFISASNELGEFESGVAARLLGPVGAVLLGSCVALAAAASWTRLFPRLSGTDRFQDAAVPAPA